MSKETKQFYFGNGNKKNRSVVIYDNTGKAVAVLAVSSDGNYDNGNVALKFTSIDIRDEVAAFAKGEQFTTVVKHVNRKVDGKECVHTVFVENELLDGISTKWKKDNSIAACSEADEVSLLFKAIKADKSGNLWQSLKGLKNDAERLAEFTAWWNDDGDDEDEAKEAEQWRKDVREKYGVKKSKRPSVTKRPTV